MDWHISSLKTQNWSNSPAIFSPPDHNSVFRRSFDSKFHLMWFHKINLHALTMLKTTHKSVLLKLSLLCCNQPLEMRQFITVDLSSYDLDNKLKRTQTHAKGSYNPMFTVRLVRAERAQHVGMQHPEMSVRIQLNTHKHPKTDDQTEQKSLQAEQRENGV